MSAPNDPTPAPLPPESADTMRLAPDPEPAFSFPASSSPVRQTIGDFEIVGKLGQGGMGAVYRARQVSLGRIVALKILPSQFEADADFVNRFQREARLAASLNHPNLVSVFSSGLADGCHYIAMELIEGETLADRLKGGALPSLEALRITLDVARALDCGWQRAHLIHRDVKPSNIFLSTSGAVKLGDLGLAKSLDADSTAMTQTGTSLGTPHYVSPEQASGDKALDFRADIYSLGCTLYQMLTGRTPYEGRDPVAVLNHHLNSPPPAILKLMPACPIPLARLVGKMLRKPWRERHASYGELIAAIENVQALLDVPPASAPPGTDAASEVAPLLPTPNPAVAPQRSKLPFNAGLAAGVLVLAFGAWLIFGPKVEPGSAGVPPADAGVSPASSHKGNASSGNDAASSSGVARETRATAGGTTALPKATKDAPFVNSLGMEFVPVPGTAVLFCRWETRAKDWAAYALGNTAGGSATGQKRDGVSLSDEPKHPASAVSWEDANAFCEWLTKKESAEGKLPKGMAYRMPTDREWSRAVGLVKETGATPKTRTGNNTVDFPWGTGYPPLKGKLGNYADESFHEKFTKETDKWIEGYTDGFASTAPVGSFPPNELGIYDLGGNVWEWCEDLYDTSDTHRVVRGASWNIYNRDSLLSSHRLHLAPGSRHSRTGFRCVVGASAR